MPNVWWALIGLFCALLINRAADCWLSPVRLQCGLTARPFRQWLLVLAMPALFMYLSFVIADERALWISAIFGSILVLLLVVDLEQGRIPNSVVYPTLAIAVLAGWQGGHLAAVLAGAAAAFTIFMLLWWIGQRLFGPQALGSGDVKLAALLGAMFGLPQVGMALLLGILLAGVAGAALLLSGRVARGDTIPYGVFLAIGGLVTLIGIPLGLSTF